MRGRGFRTFFLISLACAARAGSPGAKGVRLVSPPSDAVTDLESVSAEFSVHGDWVAVDIVRENGNVLRKYRFTVKKSRLLCRLPLESGRNVFKVTALDARGRRMKSPSFQIFRMSKTAARPGGPPAAPPGTEPLPFLQPTPSNVPSSSAPPPAPPARTPVYQEYGHGRCGYGMNQPMSIPVTDAHGTHYVSFQTDANGCLPERVELK